MHTICYLGSVMILEAYCVGKVHNMLPWRYFDNQTNYVGKSHNMLPD